MNCQEALDLLYDYIDKEASEIDADEIRKHLDGCRNCFKIYSLESAVQELIAERIKGDGPSPQLEGLKNKIILRLDGIDKENSPGQPPKSYSIMAKVLVAAASVVIIIGAASIAYSQYEHSKYYADLESAHQAVLSPEWIPPVDVAPPTFLGLDFSELGRAHGFALISSAQLQACDCEMRHFVYRNSERTISVFAASSGEYEIPPACSDNPLSHGGTTFYCHKCHEYHLLFHEVGNAVVIAASTDTEFDLFPFSPTEDVVLTGLSLP